MSSQQVDVVVAYGRSIVDASGKQILAGQTARIRVDEVKPLTDAGFIVDPEDKPAEQTARQSAEAARLAFNCFTTLQSALTVASGLRPNQEGNLARAEGFLRNLDAARAIAADLVKILQPQRVKVITPAGARE